MLKTELLKLTKGKFLLLVVLIMFVFSFFFTEREGAMRYGLFTETDMQQYFDGYKLDYRTAVTFISVYWELDKEWVEANSTDLLDIGSTIHEVQFVRLLNANLGFFVLAAFFTPYYIGMEFKTRIWNNILYVGYSRARIFWARTAAYYILILMFSLITTLVMTLLFASTIFIKAPASYIIGQFLRKAVFDGAIMSIPLIFIYFLKGAVWPALSTLFLGLILWVAMFKFGAPIEPQPVLMSSLVEPVLPVYLPRFGWNDISIIIPLIVLIVFPLISWRLFERCDLE